MAFLKPRYPKQEYVSVYMRFCFFLAGVVGTLPFLFLWKTGRIHIQGRENLKGLALERVLFVSNHPSLLEPILLVFAIAWPWGIWNPRHVPWQTPDWKNFWWLFLFSLRLIPVQRNPKTGARDDRNTYKALLKILLDARVLMFPEGTRSSKTTQVFCKTASGITIGVPKAGIGGLARARSPIGVAILVEGADEAMPVGMHYGQALWRIITGRRIVIKIGKPFTIEDPDGIMQRNDYERYLMGKIAELGALKGVTYESG